MLNFEAASVNTYRQKIKISHLQKNIKLIQKSFGTLLKHNKTQYVNTIPDLEWSKEDGENIKAYDEEEEKANLLNDYFASVSNVNQNILASNSTIVNAKLMNPITFTDGDILKRLKKTKC